jgi:hypothetical protein
MMCGNIVSDLKPLKHQDVRGECDSLIVDHEPGCATPWYVYVIGRGPGR